MKKFFAITRWSAGVVFWLAAFGAYAQGVLKTGGVETAADGASRFGGGFARLIIGDASYYIDTTGRRVFDVAYMDKVWLGDAADEVYYANALANDPELMCNEVITVKRGDKTGVLTPGGAWVLEPEYDSIDFRYRESWKVYKNGQASLYGRRGFQIPFYEDVSYMDGRFFGVKQRGRWGVYDAVEKKLTVPARYDAMDFCRSCGTAVRYVYAADQGKWGIVSVTGAVLVPLVYDHRADQVRNDDWVLSFSRGGQNLAVHIPSGKEVSGKAYREMRVASNGLLIVRKNDQYGAFGPGAKEVLPMTYDALTEPVRASNVPYTGVYVLGTKNGKTGVLDEKGAWVLKPLYQTVSVYGDQFVVKEKGLSGLVNRDGRFLQSPVYIAIEPLVESAMGEAFAGVFKVWQKEVCGLYFSQSDKLVAPAFHDAEMGALADGSVLVIQAAYNDTWRYFNEKGDTLTREEVIAQVAAHPVNVPAPPERKASADSDTFNQGEYHLLTENGKFGLKARDGKVILPPKFDDMAINRSHTPREVVFPLLCKEGDIWSYYTREGKPLNITATRVIGFYKN